MPELPSGKMRRYAELGLPPADVLLLTDDVASARYFEETIAAGAPPKLAANWILGDVAAFCNVRSWNPKPDPAVSLWNTPQSWRSSALRVLPLQR